MAKHKTNWQYKRCKECRTPREVAGRISKRGLCPSCGEKAIRENARQISDRSGPYYDAWLARWREGCGTPQEGPRGEDWESEQRRKGPLSIAG